MIITVAVFIGLRETVDAAEAREADDGPAGAVSPLGEEAGRQCHSHGSGTEQTQDPQQQQKDEGGSHVIR